MLHLCHDTPMTRASLKTPLFPHYPVTPAVHNSCQKLEVSLIATVGVETQENPRVKCTIPLRHFEHPLHSKRRGERKLSTFKGRRNPTPDFRRIPGNAGETRSSIDDQAKNTSTQRREDVLHTPTHVHRIHSCRRASAEALIDARILEMSRTGVGPHSVS